VTISGCINAFAEWLHLLSGVPINKKSYLLHKAFIFRFLATRREADRDSHGAPPTSHE
jgi:hypothetical protein